MTEDTPQRDFPLREFFNGLRWIVRTGVPWRLMPHDLPPWYVVYQQSQRWIKAGVFEALVHDLRAVLRIAEGRKESPTAAILDSRTLQSMPESGGRAGYDGASWRNQAELLLRVFTDKYLTHFEASSRQDLIDCLNASWPEYNKRFAHPFRWSWTRRQLHDWAAKMRPVSICTKTYATVH
jgi:transposase